MPILSIILFLIKYGPTIFSVVSEIVELIRKLKGQEAEAFTVDLDKAVQHWRANKDRRPLEKLRERLRSRCFGDCEK